MEITDIEDYLRSPMRIQRDILAEVQGVSAGDSFFSTSSLPIVNVFEANVLTTAAQINELVNIQRSAFPGLATSWSDLYNHLSDTDYVNLFALPAVMDSSGIELHLSVDELAAIAVATDVSGISKLVIPKHTRITVGDMVFTLEYPINITMNSQGSFSVLYDFSVDSDIQSLTTSQPISTTHVEVEDEKSYYYLTIKLPLAQYKVAVSYLSIDTSSPLTLEIPFDNQYYYCEAWMEGDSGEWTQINTTHSRVNFSLSTPTVVLEVGDSSLTATIPRAYKNNGTLTGRIKFRVFTTQGAAEKDMSTYATSQYGIVFAGEDNVSTVYTAPLQSMTSHFVTSTGTLSGGRDAQTFSEVKELIHNRSIDTGDIPITHAELSTALSNKGYTITPDVDTLTYRSFMATRDLPDPTGLKFSKAISSRMCTFTFEMDTLAEHPGVYDNSKRLTIKPSVMFELEDDVISLLDPSELTIYNEDMSDTLLSELDGRNIMQSPFHYVVDSSNYLFDVRPYVLGSPRVDARDFIGNNDSLGMVIQVDEMAVALSDNGYTIVVTTASDEVIAHLGSEVTVHAQLSFVPYRSSSRAFLEGTYVGDIDGEKCYKFEVPSTFDIDSTDHLYLNGFNLTSSDATTLPCELTHDFVVSFSVSGYGVSTDVASEYDEYVSDADIVGDVYTIGAETFTVTLGSPVTNFWTGVRTYEGSTRYTYHETDKPSTYATTQYATDEYGLIVEGFDEDDNPIYTKLAEAGDVITINGEVQYDWRIGDIVKDANGDPIVEEGVTVERQMDLFLVDARFAFVTDTLTIPYVAGIPGRILSWVNDDLSEMSNALIDNSTLKFRPTDTYGSVGVIMDDAVTGSISADQSITVRYYLESSKVTDLELQAFLRSIATSVAVEYLSKEVISTTDMEEAIKDSAGDEIISVKVSGLGGDLDLDLVTITDDSRRCSLAKTLTRQTNGIITIKDDITVEFTKHN